MLTISCINKSETSAIQKMIITIVKYSIFYSGLLVPETRHEAPGTNTDMTSNRVVWSDKTETDQGKDRQEITCTSNIASGLTIYPVFSLMKSATLILFILLASLHSDWRSSLSENCKKLAFICQNLICIKLTRSNLLLSWNVNGCKSGTSKIWVSEWISSEIPIKMSPEI